MKRTGFDNRELSWLKFNERVLEEAEDTGLPLAERLFFLSVFQSNLDEFFMVRVGSLADQMEMAEEIRENKTQMTAQEQLTAIAARVRKLNERRDKAYRVLMDQIETQGVCLVDFSSLKKEESLFLQDYFEREIQPILSPQIVGKRQPFPFLTNGGLYVAASLETRNSNMKLGLIPCFSNFFSRLIALPGQKGQYILVEDLILHFAPLVFGNYRVKSRALLRITRNADMDSDLIEEEEDYRDYMEELVRRRVRRCAVRMELSGRLPANIVAQLCDYLKLEKNQLYYCHTPMDLSFVQDIRHVLRDRTDLFYEKRTPQKALMVDEDVDMWQQAARQDRLLSYPYESMKPFLQMLEQAAEDPDVISIKMTLYRLARGSKIVDALIEAAENGKEVLVLLELSARFDEENNIEWSRRLEEAGCRILYGLDGFKVHSKLCLITARKEGKISYLTQIGTGNYNEKTARQYTDLSYITADHRIGAEVSHIFHCLCLGQAPEGCEKLLVAPCTLQSGILRRIEEQIQAAEEGRPAYIGMKMNSLTDRKIIDALMRASAARVPVELIVRGSCCIVGGIAGKTDSIRVISIVGRFLEHSRIYLFGQGPEQKVYIGSADLMTRNTTRRVEVLTPVSDEACKERLRQMFAILLSDNQNSRMQRPDGKYERRRPKEGEPPVNAQEYFYQMAYEQKDHREMPVCSEEEGEETEKCHRNIPTSPENRGDEERKGEGTCTQ